MLLLIGAPILNSAKKPDSPITTRHKLFGITGAATKDAETGEAYFDRHKLFGITGAATCYCRRGRCGRPPPQTLWNHGCGDHWDLMREAVALARHKLFGITGAATNIGGQVA